MDDDEMKYQRIVQLGWACGAADHASDTVVKKFYVAPVGFEVSSKATNLHKITEAVLSREGKPLADVLQDATA